MWIVHTCSVSYSKETKAAPSWERQLTGVSPEEQLILLDLYKLSNRFFVFLNVDVLLSVLIHKVFYHHRLRRHWSIG